MIKIVGQTLGNLAKISTKNPFQTRNKYYFAYDQSDTEFRHPFDPFSMDENNSQAQLEGSKFGEWVLLKNMEKDTPLAVKQNISTGILTENASTKLTVYEFSKEVDFTQRGQNSKIFMELFNLLLSDYQLLKITKQIQQYAHQRAQYKLNNNQKYQGKKQKAKNAEITRNFFKSIYDELMKNIIQIEFVEKLMVILSKSDPSKISYDEAKKISISNSINFEGKTLKNLFKQYETSTQSLNPINLSLDNKMPTNIRFKMSRKIENSEFAIEQNSMQNIDRILFKNQKIVSNHIVFKKVVTKQVDPKAAEYGKNWVYCYDLPYNIESNQIYRLINYISEKNGKINGVFAYPYKNVLEKKTTQILYQLSNQQEENFAQNNNLKAFSIPIEPKQPTQQKSKTSTDIVLDKIQKNKSSLLNKSFMLFKFESQRDKLNFLSPEMRLYGLNFERYSNIRFEQAETKNVLILSRLPWGCSSINLIHHINERLKGINIEVTYENSVLAKGHIFIEFDNFYECFYAQNALNRSKFQGQTLAAQINYGSCRIFDNNYQNQLDLDHHQTMLQTLKGIRSYYQQHFKQE